MSQDFINEVDHLRQILKEKELLIARQNEQLDEANLVIKKYVETLRLLYERDPKLNMPEV